MKTILLKVDGMSCSHCENAVKKAVGSLNGVLSVNVDLAEKSVLVEYHAETLTVDEITLAIEDQGYDVIK